MAQNVYAVIQVVCVILTYISVIRLLQCDHLSKEYKVLIVVMCFIFVYNVCNTFQVYVQSEEAALIAVKLRTLCIGQILLYMFKFVRKYCKVIIPQWIPIIYWIINAVLVVTVFGARRGTFFFKSIEFVKQGNRGYLLTEPGPMYYLFIFFCLSLGIWMFGIICYSYLKRKRKWGWGEFCITLSIVLPLIGGVLYFAGFFGSFNPSGITLFLAVELLIVSADKYRMFDVLQGARERIIDTMNQAIAARNEADRANRAKTRFLSNMSHELRTPLNAIIGISEIELGKQLSEETRFNLQSIYYSGQNLLGLVNNLLDISKIEAEKLVIEKAEYHIDSLLYEVANIIFTSLRESEVEFKVLVEETVPKHLIGDAVRIRGILTNLLGNAVKYTKKGHIYLKVFWRTDGEKDSGYLNFIVEDTGVGVKPEKLDTIFDEYEQINSEETKGITGTGLGLSIVKQLVELMDGEIHVKSRYGKGSTFEAYVKQGAQNKERIGRVIITRDNIVDILEKDRFEKVQIESFFGKRVLVVDDMEVNRTVLKGILEPYQLVIDTAANGKEAVEKVQNNDYDLLLMDHMMPEMDGLKTLKAIRNLSDEKFKVMPVVLVTANVMAEEENELQEYGFQDYLTKPINGRKLIRVLKKWLDGYGEAASEEESIIPAQLQENSNIDNEEIKLPVKIDRAEGLSHVGGKIELYEEVLQAFYHDGTKVLDKLKNADELQTTELRILIHGIKGSSHNIGAMELGDEAEQIEIALKKDNREYAKANLPSMMQHLKEVLDTIPVPDRIPADFALMEVKEKREMDEEFEYTLMLLRSDFVDCNMSAVEDRIEELERFDYGEEAAKKIEQLKKCIQDVEYETGVEILEQWLMSFLKF